MHYNDSLDEIDSNIFYSSIMHSKDENRNAEKKVSITWWMKYDQFVIKFLSVVNTRLSSL